MHRHPALVNTSRLAGALIVGAVFCCAPAAGALTHASAASAAKRAASRSAARRGLRYPPSTWRADCRPTGHGRWHCDAGTGGQCSASVRVTGSAQRPRAIVLDMRCLD